MKFLVILLGTALCLLSSTEAGISTDSPYKAIVWNGGDNVKVSWSDDGSAPPLEQIGVTTVDLMAGGDSVQVLVDNIGQTQASAKEIAYTVPKTIGPPGDFYFIKYTAGTYSSFSGTFTISGIEGEIGGFDPKNPNGKNPTVSASPAPATPSTSSTPSTPSTPNTPNNPNTNATNTDAGNSAAASSSTAVKSPLPSTLSGAANLLPSFAGIATAAVALTLTYFY